MDILDKIINCQSEELDKIINDHLIQMISNSENNKKLGFPENWGLNSKIIVHKGFIPPDTKIKYSNYSMNTYSMNTDDYFYEFARFIKKYQIKNKGSLVKLIQNFINNYFGLPSSKDMRDAYFDDLAFKTTKTDEEYFQKLEQLTIGNLKGKKIAMCTERAAIAQNLLSFFGIDTYYCMGCLDNNAVQEAHCFNIAKAKENFILLDYSVPVSIFNNNKLIDYAPFQGTINQSDIEKKLFDGEVLEFSSYEYIQESGKIKKVPTSEIRNYIVGNLSFENKNNHERR